MKLQSWLSQQIQSIQVFRPPGGLSESYFSGMVFRYLSKRTATIGALTFFRFTLHLFRFKFLATYFPLINLHEMIDLYLGLSLVEAFFYGFCEDIRQKSRTHTPTKFHLLIQDVRKRKSLALLLSALLLLYYLNQNVFALLTTTRVLSVYDIIGTLYVLKTVSHLFFLPDFALLQGFSRLRIKPSQLILPEVASVLMLFLFSEILGAWGVVLHLGVDLLLRESLRLYFLHRTQSSLGIKYRLLRVSFFLNGFYLVGVNALKQTILGLTQLLFRVESILLLGFLSTFDEDYFSLFLILPLLRFSSDFVRLAQFDRLKVRNLLDAIAWKKVRIKYVLAAVGVGAALTRIGFYFAEPNISVGYAFVFLCVSAMLSFFAIEIYSKLIERFFSNQFRKRAVAYWVCKIRKKSLSPARLEVLIDRGAYFFGRGELWVPISKEPDEKDKIHWIRFFGGELLSIVQVSKNDVLKMVIRRDECENEFSKLQPEGTLSVTLDFNAKFDQFEALKQMNYYLKFGCLKKPVSQFRVNILAGLFGSNEVVFFSFPKGTLSDDFLKWRDRLSQHVKARMVLEC